MPRAAGLFCCADSAVYEQGNMADEETWTDDRAIDSPPTPGSNGGERIRLSGEEGNRGPFSLDTRKRGTGRRQPRELTVAAEWSSGPRTAAWDQLWRRILGHVLAAEEQTSRPLETKHDHA